MDLNQVTLPATDLARSVAFYRCLGLRLIVDSLPRYARFECPEGNATVSLHRVDRVPCGEGITIYFECTDLDEKVAMLKDTGHAIEWGPVDQTWLWREAHLSDPDGHAVILYYAGKNRRFPPWRVEVKDA